MVSRISGLLAAQLNPALNAQKPAEEVRTELFKRENYSRLTIPTSDGFSLDGLKIKAPNSQKALIFCLGSGGHYEELQTKPNDILDKMVQTIKKQYPDRSIIIVNGRGVGASTGYPYYDRDHKTDIDAIVGHTKETHTDIVVWGHSMGALMAAKSDEKVVLDRAFSSVSEVITHKLGLTGFTATAVSTLVWALGWEYNLESRVHQLSPEKVRVIYSEQDATIPASVSLGARNPALPCVVKMNIRRKEGVHTAPLTKKELTKLDILIK